MQTWDNLDDGSGVTKPEKSFFTLPYKDPAGEEIIHKWLKDEKDHLISINRTRIERIQKNLALVKGLQYRDQDRRGIDDREGRTQKRQVQKVVFNILLEAQETRDSKLLKYKPNVVVMPNNDKELGDKVAAEMMTNLKDHIWYTERLEGAVAPEWIHKKSGQGESYLFVTWDPHKGDIHNEYKKEIALNKLGRDVTPEQIKEFIRSQKFDKYEHEKVPLRDEMGNPEKDELGNDIYVEKPIRNGDVKYFVDGPLNTFFERTATKKLKDAKYLFWREVLDVDEAKLLYPDKVENIEGSEHAQFYDAEECSTYSDANKVEVWHFYYKRHFTLEKGRWIVFTDKGVISNKEFPFSHDMLPCVPLVDRKRDEEQHGVSFIEDAKGPAGAFNNISNIILQNEILVGRPKWMLPAGMAEIKDLSNSTTVVQFKGLTPPVLVQANPTGATAFNLRQILREECMQGAAVSRTGNGNPPQGITAAVALQYLAELESERWNATVLQYNEAILQLVIMTFAVCGDFYDPSDERMLRIQGLDGEWQGVFFEQAVLSKSYDIRVQGASALPESKAARTESLLFLKKEFPEQVDPEQILDMFDFAQSKKFTQEGTISTRAAQSENEMLMQGKSCPDPESYEDLIIHWKLHVKQMREWAFKNRTNPEVQMALKDHVMATEMLIYERIKVSPSYQMQVDEKLVGFPLFYKPNPDLISAPPLNPAAAAAMPPQGLPPQMPPPQGPMNLPPEELNQGLDGMPAVEPGVPPTEMIDGDLPPIEPVSSM